MRRYVFPGSSGGRIVEPRKQLFKVAEWSGGAFTLHDLRRTFITVAESLELSQYAIKHLVNHKMPNDVTAGYIVMDPERLRSAMEKITQAILLAAGVKASSNIVPITMKEHAR
jgi:integrase